MNLLVVGCGSAGKRHVRNLTALAADCDTVYAYDTNPDALGPIVEATGAVALRSLDAVADRGIEASVVAVPNHLHFPIARRLLEMGSSVLVEKPISHTLEGVDGLIRTARETGKVLLTGYNLRFHPNLDSARRRIESGAIGRVLAARVFFGFNLALWRPHLDYRLNYGARRAEGGGVVLDLIHEIDYVLWLLGDVKRVSAFVAKRTDLEIDTEDVAAIVLEMASGAIVQLHLDYADLAYDRGFRIVGSAGTLEWDMPAMTLRSYDGASRQWSEERATFDFNDTYMNELKHFLGAVRGAHPAHDDGSFAKRGLEICLAIKRSAETGRVVEP